MYGLEVLMTKLVGISAVPAEYTPSPRLPKTSRPKQIDLGKTITGLSIMLAARPARLLTHDPFRVSLLQAHQMCILQNKVVFLPADTPEFYSPYYICRVVFLISE